MKILSRYISLLFIKNFLLSLLGLTFLFFFQAVMAKYLEGDFTLTQILIYYAYETPLILVQMAPPSALMATVLTLSHLSRTNELVACFSIGVSMKQIVWMFFSLVFLVSCISIVMQDRILPPFYKLKTAFFWRDMKQRPEFFLDIQKDKVWYRSKNMIYNLRTFDPNANEIRGMSVYTFDEHFNLIQVLESEKAFFTPEGWTLETGTVTVFSTEDQFPLTRKFASKSLQISETPEDFREIEKETQGLRIKELWGYIQKSKEAGLDTKKHEVEFHSKFSLAFIPIVMMFLAIPFSLRTQREGGVAKDVGVGLAVTGIYWIAYSIGLSLGNNGSLPPIYAAWLPSLFFLVMAFGAIYYKKR